MAVTNKSWFLKPAANTIGTLFTATDNTTVIGQIRITNHSTATTFRVYVVPSGQSVWDIYWIRPIQKPIQNLEVIQDIWPIALSSWDTIQVKSTSGNVAFSCFWQSQW